MSQIIKSIIDSFCAWAVWLAFKLKLLLLGSPPIGQQRGKGRISQFILFELHYPPLRRRLIFFAVAGLLLWGASWLAAKPGFVTVPFYASLLARLALVAVEFYLALLVVRYFADAPGLARFGRMLT